MEKLIQPIVQLVEFRPKRDRVVTHLWLIDVSTSGFFVSGKRVELGLRTTLPAGGMADAADLNPQRWAALPLARASTDGLRCVQINSLQRTGWSNYSCNLSPAWLRKSAPFYVASIKYLSFPHQFLALKLRCFLAVLCC